jgi:isocitrate lyase
MGSALEQLPPFQAQHPVCQGAIAGVVSHQQEVGAGYFDDVTTVIQGGQSSVKSLSGSTEEEQFH